MSSLPTMRSRTRWVVGLIALGIVPASVGCDLDRGRTADVDAGASQVGPMAPVGARGDAAEDAAGAAAPAPEEQTTNPGSASGDAAVRAEAGAAVTTPPHDAAIAADDARAAAPALLTALNDVELATLCRWAEGLRAVPSERQLCISRSLQARSKAACVAQVESCLASHAVDAPPRPPCNESFVRQLPARCAELQVEAYRSCALAAADVANQRLSSLSCDRIDTPDTSQGVLPACADLARVCPELAPDDSGGASPWSGGSFVCRDGWPLFSDEVCNGKADCLGGEDETSC